MATKLKDGFSTRITITGLTPIDFEEIDVNPPALDSGGEIDQTTMRNTRWRTRVGKQLATLGGFSARVAYSANMYKTITDILGTNRHIVVTFPDGSTLTFYAIVDKFDPGELKEGERPVGTLELIPSLLNTSNPPAETAPVLVTATP